MLKLVCYCKYLKSNIFDFQSRISANNFNFGASPFLLSLLPDLKIEITFHRLVYYLNSNSIWIQWPSQYNSEWYTTLVKDTHTHINCACVLMAGCFGERMTHVCTSALLLHTQQHKQIWGKKCPPHCSNNHELFTCSKWREDKQGKCDEMFRKKPPHVNNDILYCNGPGPVSALAGAKEFLQTQTCHYNSLLKLQFRLLDCESRGNWNLYCTLDRSM